MVVLAVATALCFVFAWVLLHAEQPFLAAIAALIGLVIIGPLLLRYLGVR